MKRGQLTVKAHTSRQTPISEGVSDATSPMQHSVSKKRSAFARGSEAVEEKLWEKLVTSGHHDFADVVGEVYRIGNRKPFNQQGLIVE
jgi:hypothetical protein